MVNSEQTPSPDEATQSEQEKELTSATESSPTPSTPALSASVLKARLTSLMDAVPVPSTPAAKRVAVGTGVAATTATVAAIAVRSATTAPEITPISSQWTFDAFSNMSSNDMSKLSDAPGYLASAGIWISDKASIAWNAIYNFGHAIVTSPVDFAQYLGLPELFATATGMVASSIAFLLRGSADITGWSAEATKNLGDTVAGALEAGATLAEENPAVTAAATVFVLSSTAAVAGLAALRMRQNGQAKLKELADATVAQKAAAVSATATASTPAIDGSSTPASSNDAAAASNDSTTTATPTPTPTATTFKP